jgi:hypothetical protein
MLYLPYPTEVVDHEAVPAIVRFLDRQGSSWNLANVSTLMRSPPTPAVEEGFVLEHMQLELVGPVVEIELEMAGPLEFKSSPGDFDFDPGEE